MITTSITEEFIYNDQTYIIYLDVGYSDIIITIAKSQCGGVPIEGKTYIQRDNRTIWLSTGDVLVSSEIDGAIMAFIQDNGFADLTPVEYLRKLGLV
jgi:hypothetical protein